jgi:hypothetical protein
VQVKKRLIVDTPLLGGVLSSSTTGAVLTDSGRLHRGPTLSSLPAAGPMEHWYMLKLADKLSLTGLPRAGPFVVLSSSSWLCV